jgi:cytochrome c5
MPFPRHLQLGEFAMLKSLLFVSAIFLFVIAPAPAPTLAAGPVQEAAPAPAATKTTPAAQEKAKKIYAVDCALCHADNGNGKSDLAKDMGLTLADWTDPKALSGKSDKELFDMIRNGKDKMPPEGDGRAKDDDVRALIIYIRNMSKDQAAPAGKPTN